MAIKLYSRGDTTKLAKNFRAREFDCHGSGCCTSTPIDERLVEYLQRIRDYFGKPIEITAYRCPVYNQKVANAAVRSYHTYGQAADFHIDGVPAAEIAKYAESLGVLGIGLYDTFVHIDTRVSKSYWYGHAQERRETFGGNPAQISKAGDTLEQFIREVQAATGSKVDGVAGPEILRNTVTVSVYVNNRHPVVKAVQVRLAELGYTEVGTADGIAGPRFTKAIIHFQQDNDCKADGEITAGQKSWRKLLGME